MGLFPFQEEKIFVLFLYHEGYRSGLFLQLFRLKLVVCLARQFEFEHKFAAVLSYFHFSINYFQDQLDKFVEEQLQPNSAAGSGALEHDHCWLYRPEPDTAFHLPLPLGVALIDQSVLVFGKVFPRAAAKHRFQMLQHFNDCLKTASKAARAEALQMNIFAALLAGFKGLVEDKSILGGKEAVLAATELVAGVLVSPNALLRYAAADCMGRLAQVVGDHKVITEMAQKSFDFLKSARDVASRTGHSFALGCLHRWVPAG